jgi:hypothetical protein
MKRFKQILFFLIVLISFSCLHTRKSVPPPPPPPAVLDRDGDGTLDSLDRCPDVAGMAALQGCPDKDGDGIADMDDGCPDLAGATNYQGCPPRDADGDGFADDTDRCPTVAGTEEGCPEMSAPGNGDPHVDHDTIDIPLENNNHPYNPSKGSHQHGEKADMEGPGSSGNEGIENPGSNNPDKAVASIVVSSNKVIPVGDSRYVEMIVELNKSLDSLQQEIQSGLNQMDAVKMSEDDTSKAYRYSLPGGKTFIVEIDVNEKYLKVVKTHKAKRQDLAFPGKTIWGWDIEGVEGNDATVINIRVTTVDAQGKEHENKTLSFSVKVVGKRKPYSWLWVVGGLLLLIPAFMLWQRKKAAVRKDQRVYFSYAWGDPNENVIIKLYESLEADGFNVLRDKTNLQLRSSITSFMTDIGKANYVIVAISDKYLKSHYCMFELFEVYRNSGMDKQLFMNKIFPIRMEDINLGDPLVSDTYIEYWKKLEDDWKAKLDEADENNVEQTRQLEIIRRISLELGSIMAILADTNSFNIQDLSKNDFAGIKTELKRSMA